MKSSLIERATSAILAERKIGSHLARVGEKDRRKILMGVANREISYSGDPDLSMDALGHLGFRDEEILVFASAAAIYQPSIVPRIVKRYCRNTAIARRELGVAVRSLLGIGVNSCDTARIHDMLDCIELMEPRLRWSNGFNYETGLYMQVWCAVLDIEEKLQQARLSTDVLESVKERFEKMVPEENIRRPILNAAVLQRQAERSRKKRS